MKGVTQSVDLKTQTPDPRSNDGSFGHTGMPHREVRGRGRVEDGGAVPEAGRQKRRHRSFVDSHVLLVVLPGLAGSTSTIAATLKAALEAQKDIILVTPEDAPQIDIIPHIFFSYPGPIQVRVPIESSCLKRWSGIWKWWQYLLKILLSAGEKHNDFAAVVKVFESGGVTDEANGLKLVLFHVYKQWLYTYT